MQVDAQASSSFLGWLMGFTVERTRIRDAGGFVEQGRVNGACLVCVHCCGYLTDDLYQATSHYREGLGTSSSREMAPCRLKNRS